MMRIIASPAFAVWRRARARIRRRLRREPPVIHYFHQVDDPYSQLAVQKLDALKTSYGLPILPHLVGPPVDEFKGDTGRYAHWAARDAASIASYYAVDFPAQPVIPAEALVQQTNQVLAAKLSEPDFAGVAAELGAVIWRGDSPAIISPRQDGAVEIRNGEALRQQLGHYFGGMFYFDGEWYWGLDRLHLLETRLKREGYGEPGAPLVAPLPQIRDTPIDGNGCTLEYFPSLRSPYTAVGHQRVLALVERTGVKLELRPVIPMMMRGVPAPRAKRLHIMTDAAREARFHGVPFGRFVDPLGEPVRKAFAWYPVAQSQGKGLEFVTAYLAAAFARGLDITRAETLLRLLGDIGVDTGSGPAAADVWEPRLQENLDAMLASGLWGVPSFRITDESDAPAFACWGQDRIWRVEAEIATRAARLSGVSAL